MRQTKSQPGELALAIKLNEERGRLWQTNLAAFLEFMTGSRVVVVPGRSNGWQMQFSAHGLPATANRPPITRICDLTRAGEWTVVGLGEEPNQLLTRWWTWSCEDPTILDQTPKDFWLFADVDLRGVASALSLDWDLPAELPRITMGVTGDGQTVRTRGQLNFAQPLPFELEPWNIPTNLMHEPLVSFTAVQGVRPWLSSLKLLQGLDFGTPPNRLFFWAQRGPEFLSYSAPMTNASNWVERATERLLQKPDVYLATEGMGRFELKSQWPGRGLDRRPVMRPFLQPAALSGGEFVFGGWSRRCSPTARRRPS